MICQVYQVCLKTVINLGLIRETQLVSVRPHQHGSTNSTTSTYKNDKSYYEEYSRLEKVATWEVIMEAECQQIKHLLKHTSPAMVIEVMKKDWDDKPINAKYCIVPNMSHPH